jgi:hypothetical protein
MTALEEMGIVMRAVPGPAAGVGEIAGWYRLKAELLDHLAAESTGAEALDMRRKARRARAHAAELLSSSRKNSRDLAQNKVGGLAASKAS